VVFSVADNRVAHRRKLRSDLILQSCHQLNPDERSIRKKAFDGISKFGTSRLGVSRRAQLLKHSFTSKIVHERPCLNSETAVAQLERDLIRERVSAGVRNARACGKELGRPRRIVDHDRLVRLKAEGASLRQIAEALGIGYGTVRTRLQQAS
jgi:lambda repressor-like predicted transcriptional regulator